MKPMSSDIEILTIRTKSPLSVLLKCDEGWKLPFRTRYRRKFSRNEKTRKNKYAAPGWPWGNGKILEILSMEATFALALEEIMDPSYDSRWWW